VSAREPVAARAAGSARASRAAPTAAAAKTGAIPGTAGAAGFATAAGFTGRTRDAGIPVNARSARRAATGRKAAGIPAGAPAGPAATLPANRGVAAERHFIQRHISSGANEQPTTQTRATAAAARSAGANCARVLDGQVQERHHPGRDEESMLRRIAIQRVASAIDGQCRAAGQANGL
jgi:hypothetical protein